MGEPPDPVTGAFEVTGILEQAESHLADNLLTNATPLEVTVTDTPGPVTINLGKRPSVTPE